MRPAGRFSDDYVYRLRLESEELLNRVEELEAVINKANYASYLSKICRALNITRSQAEIIRVLMKYECVPVESLYSCLSERALEDPINSIRVRVHAMRKRNPKLKEFVKNVHGVGYFITAEDKIRLAEIID